MARFWAALGHKVTDLPIPSSPLNQPFNFFSDAKKEAEDMSLAWVATTHVLNAEGQIVHTVHKS